MNRIKPSVWLALVLLALSGCAALQQQIKPPELSLSQARITAMSLADAALAFDVDVHNPNPIGVSMRGLSYSLQIQDRPLVKGALDRRLEIAAGERSRVSLPFVLRYEDIFGTLVALRDNRELHYTISGEADFGLIRLPYSKSGTFALPALPDIRLEKLRVERLGLSGVDLTLALSVGNDNDFPIRLDGLDYQLKLAGSALLRGETVAPLSIAPHQQGRLELRLSLQYAQLGALLNTLRSASAMPVEFSSRMRLPGLHGATELPYSWKGSVPLFR